VPLPITPIRLPDEEQYRKRAERLEQLSVSLQSLPRELYAILLLQRHYEVRAGELARVLNVPTQSIQHWSAEALNRCCFSY
jgi:DNA-directed RNA polymerase specialized sigma24 family protein